MAPSSRDQPEPAPRRRADVTAVGLDGEVVLYDAATQRLHHLNATAALVWQHCDGARAVGEIADAIAAEATTAIGAARIAADVAALVEEFPASGLLDPPRQFLIKSEFIWPGQMNSHLM